MNKYQKIDRDKLSPKGKTLYDKLKKKSNNFEDTDGKLGEILEAFYNKTQTKPAKAEPKKPAKSKPKAKAKSKPKAKAKTKAKAKAKKKTTKKATKSKSGNTGSFAKLRAAIAKRDGITYKQALPIAKKEYAKQKESITKNKRGKTESRLSAYKRKYKSRGTEDVKERGSMRPLDIEKDSKIPALPRGKRVSKGTGANQYGKAKKGKVYYENRSNRTDVRQPSKKVAPPKLAKGGKVEFFDKDSTENRFRRKIWEGYKNVEGQESVGSFAHKVGNKIIGDYYLFPLSDFDEKFYSHLPLKQDEILFRTETETGRISKSLPLVKVNIANGRVYFMSEDNDPYSDEDDKNPKFNTSSANVTYISLDSKLLDYAKGGKVSKSSQIFVLQDDEYGNELFRGVDELNEYLQEFNEGYGESYKTFEDFNKGESKQGRKIVRTYGDGGRINIVNEGVKFDKKKYRGALGDFDKDGVPNIDDAKPLTKTGKQERVEQVELSKTFERLLKLKSQLDSTMNVAIDELDEVAPDGAEIYARTKTPYSILKKLVEKRLTDKNKGLTDLVGTTIAVDDYKDLRKVDKEIKNGAIGKVVEREDMYDSPKGGYRAVHYLVEADGYIIEVQLKTKRQKDVNVLSHNPYKKGTINKEYLLKLTNLANKADKGNKNAIKEFNEIMKDKEKVERQLDTSYEFGGEIRRDYDVNINSGVGTYAKGGNIKDYQTSVEEYPSGFSVRVKFGKENKLLNDTFESKEKAISFAKRLAEKNNGSYEGFNQPIVYLKAKGGKVNDIVQEFYGMNLNEIDGEGIDDVRKLKAIIFELNNRLEEERGVLPFDSEAQGFDKDGNPYGYDNLPFAKGGEVKNGYIAMYKGKKIEVYANSSYAAQKKAAEMFNTKKSYDVRVYLAEQGGQPVMQSTMFNEGGDVTCPNCDSTFYAKGGFIQDAVEEMKKKGTVGAFTKQAKRREMTPVEFAMMVLKNPEEYSDKTRQRAQFVKNANPELFSFGGDIRRDYDVNINSGVGTYAEGGKISEAGDTDFPSELLNYAKGGKTERKVYNVAIRRKKDGYWMDLLPFDVTKSQAEKIAKDINGMIPNSAKAEIPLPFAKGGKTQGYNSRLDESLGNRTGAEIDFEQKKKDRRDESKAMEKARGKRAYSSVRTMDRKKKTYKRRK